MSERPAASHDPLAGLISAAGRRETPPAPARERALAAVTQVWEAKVRRRRWRLAASLAASVAAVAVGVGVAIRLLDFERTAAPPIATVARVIGAVEVGDADAHHWTSLREDTAPLPAGALVRTEAVSAAALQLGEVSVRISADSEIMLESQSRIELLRGKVYVDTDTTSDAGRMSVIAAQVSVSDVGTQFEVQYRDDAYRVRVREGAILLQRGAQRRRGAAGDEISIDRAGAVSMRAISADDAAWRWTQSLASAPDIDNQPLTVLLRWVARETGVAVRYASPAIERKATATILHGSIRHLEPLEALAVMLATTDLQHEVLTDGTIMIK